MKNQKHGNPKQHDNLFDSDLCGCGCAAGAAYVSPAEADQLLKAAQLLFKEKEEGEKEGNSDVRALAHARAVNARAEFLGARKEAA